MHRGSMTRRLEQQFGGRVSLRPLSACVGTDWYSRWSLLLAPGGRCLAIGGSCLRLDVWSAALRQAILDGQEPLGRLLERHGVDYESVPRAVFTVDPSPQLTAHLQMREPRRLFGRRTDFRLAGLSGYRARFVLDGDGSALRLLMIQPEGIYPAKRKG